MTIHSTKSRSTPDLNDSIEDAAGGSSAAGDTEAEKLRLELASTAALLADATARYREIEGSVAYRVGLRLSKGPVGKMYRAIAQRRAARSTPPARAAQFGVTPGPIASSLKAQATSICSDEAILALPLDKVVAVAHPDWLGIRSSAAQMFDHLLLLTDELTPEDGESIAHRLLARRPQAVVLQGFPFTYQHLVQALHRQAPNVPVHVVWHGTFMQAPEDYAWRSFRLMCALHRQGKIRRIGLVKKGQEQILQHRGIDAHYLLNMYRVIPDAATNVPVAPIKLGIWSISELKHKPPYEMLAAASIIDGAQVVGSVASERMLEFCKEFGLAQSFLGRMVPQAEMPAQLATTHLNLYVTLNECAPMLPLESFGVGVPCIVGPNTPYFENNPYLQSRLIVPVPDDAYAIAQKIKLALSERDQIIAAYREYAVEHNAESALTLQRFLN
ncbi:glycosyltransferase [Achromobacter mucicolens]|uniref:glycosyltransferase n=1 Tax=Achromobacter mucicolens TaxID=1389922 RepID=UPI00100824E8|nr:glycosyltransferase [Achromobacter mucicolens]